MSYLEDDAIEELFYDLSASTQSHIAFILGRRMKELHCLSLRHSKIHKKSWYEWKRFLTVQKRKCVKSHEEWALLREEHILKLSSYLPRLVRKLMDEKEEPAFLHGDVTGENIFGVFVEQKQDCEVTGLIDFAETMVRL